jgi:hypothetical protein
MHDPATAFHQLTALVLAAKRAPRRKDRHAP